MIQWNDFVVPGRPACTSVFLCLAFFVWLCYSGLIHCESIIALAFRCQHVLQWGRRMFMLVASMARSRWNCTHRRYVCIFVLGFVVVLLGFDAVWGHISTFIPLSYTTMTTIGARLSRLHQSNDPIGAGRTGSTSIFLCLTEKLSLAFDSDSVWGHNLTFIPGQNNICWWRWSACIYFVLIDGTISLTLDEQEVRFYSCAWIEAVFWVLFSLRSQFHPHSFSK